MTQIFFPGDLLPSETADFEKLNLSEDSFYIDQNGRRRARTVVDVRHPSRNDATSWGVGSTVIGRVIRMQADKAEILLFGVEPSDNCKNKNLVLFPSGGYGHTAQLRKTDMRRNQIDEYKIDELYRVGDIVRCRVIAKTPQHTLLSTMRSTDGVIVGKTKTGMLPGLPVSHQEMLVLGEEGVQETTVIEKRKMAYVGGGDHALLSTMKKQKTS